MKDPFRSERLVYRAARPGVQQDIDVFQALNDDRIGFVNSNIGNIRLPGPADAAAYLKSVSEDLLGAIICLKDDSGQAGTPIGELHLAGSPPYMRHHRNTEIGIDILPAHQGKGYGTEVVRWALHYAFQMAGLHKVRIRAFEYNHRAIRLYEGLGFVHEGREREAVWWDGRFWDSVEMGMLDREWRALQDGTRDSAVREGAQPAQVIESARRGGRSTEDSQKQQVEA